MKILETPFHGLKIIEPSIFPDTRGYFFESYNRKKMEKNGINHEFIQDNESFSIRGVIRGLHYQLEPYAQTKLVRVVRGEVMDVVADLRRGSPTYGKWFGVSLSSDNKRQLLIPKGFAHGFSVLSDEVVFVYKCDQVYHKTSERCIRFNDPFLNINWEIPSHECFVSEKDRNAPFFQEAEMNFSFEQ